MKMFVSSTWVQIEMRNIWWEFIVKESWFTMITYGNTIVSICFHVSFVGIFLMGQSILSLASFELVTPNTQWMEFNNVDSFNLLVCAIDTMEWMSRKMDCSFEEEGGRLSPSKDELNIVGRVRFLMVKRKSMWGLLCLLYVWSPLSSVLGSQDYNGCI